MSNLNTADKTGVIGAMASEVDQNYFELPKELAGDLVGREIESTDYDRYESSVLCKLADDVKIGIVGKVVSMTVTKIFEG